MNQITTQNFNSPQFTPVFKGYSRKIQTQIDRVLQNPNDFQLNSDLASTIKQGLGSILTPKKYIEEGTHNVVFSITRKYALRVPKKAKLKTDELPNALSLGQGVFAGLRHYFGEAILELGNLQILRNIGRHRPAGVPEHIAKFYSRNRITSYYLKKYLPKFANVPQSQYDILAGDINKLNEIQLGPRRFCTFDSLNPNNIVCKNHVLYLVDDIDTLCDRSYSNTTAKLLEVFVNRATKDIEAPYAGDKVPLVRKIFKKVVLASTRANLLQANSKFDFENWVKALQKCGIKNDASEVIAKIEDIELHHPDKEARVSKVKVYLDYLFYSNKL